MFKNVKRREHNYQLTNKSFRCKTQLSFKRLPNLTQIKQIIPQSQLTELAQWNDKKSLFKILSYYNRSRSSQSKTEGFLNNKDQQIMLSLPYKCVKLKKQQHIRKMWRKYIIIIMFALCYQKRQLKHYLSHIPKFYSNTSPRIQLEGIRRKRIGGSQVNFETFGDYINYHEQQIAKTKRFEDIKLQKSPIYQRFNDQRITRILKNSSINISVKESPNKRSFRYSERDKLPPLVQINRRIYRINSNR